MTDRRGAPFKTCRWDKRHERLSLPSEMTKSDKQLPELAANSVGKSPTFAHPPRLRDERESAREEGWPHDGTGFWHQFPSLHGKPKLIFGL